MAKAGLGSVVVSEGFEGIKELSAQLGDLPWGVWTQGLTKEKQEMLKSSGCDYVVFSAEGTALESLEEGEMARVLEVPLDTDEKLLVAIEDLPVDAVVFKASNKPSSSLSWLMDVAAARKLIDLPALVRLQGPLAPAALAGLRDVGINGVVLESGEAGLSVLKELSHAMGGLPQRRKRSERIAPMLPRTAWRSGSTAPKPEEEEEEDDEEEI
ncbi:MAG: hypothetical protein HY676_00335 [Chloroflexi bacterium]|nr:hypothetical protein [Chloroflexota bacterium]